eukprot:XP_019920237.1 PREDICTED: uncharacterized protein LOC109617846 [Crassostrea gigas]
MEYVRIFMEENSCDNFSDNYALLEQFEMIALKKKRQSRITEFIDWIPAVVNRTFIFGDKTVSSVPDLAYGFASRPVAVQKNVLLSVVEVEGKPVNNDMSECLEDQLESDVLGRMGSELFAVVPHSVMFPNSLGIICMGTKVMGFEDKILKTRLIQMPIIIGGFTQVWIGLTDIVDEDIYVYPSDGAKSVYLNWNIGQPSGGKGENCAALRIPFQKWHDFPCNNNVSYICKKPAKHFV